MLFSKFDSVFKLNVYVGISNDDFINASMIHLTQLPYSSMYIPPFSYVNSSLIPDEWMELFEKKNYDILEKKINYNNVIENKYIIPKNKNFKILENDLHSNKKAKSPIIEPEKQFRLKQINPSLEVENSIDLLDLTNKKELKELKDLKDQKDIKKNNMISKQLEYTETKEKIKQFLKNLNDIKNNFLDMDSNSFNFQPKINDNINVTSSRNNLKKVLDSIHKDETINTVASKRNETSKNKVLKRKKNVLEKTYSVRRFSKE